MSARMVNRALTVLNFSTLLTLECSMLSVNGSAGLCRASFDGTSLPGETPRRPLQPIGSRFASSDGALLSACGQPVWLLGGP